MKKLLIYTFLAISLIAVHHTATAKAQQVPISLVGLSSIGDLRTLSPQAPEMATLLGSATPTDGNGANYYWNSTSTATDDGYNVVAVTGITTGRWLRMGTGQTIYPNVTRPINSTTFTVSTTRWAFVAYNISISCTATIGSTASGSVALQYSTNAGSTWITESTVSNSNTVTLAIVLNSVNTQGVVLSGIIPANALVRMVSTTAGTTTIAIAASTEFY